MHGGAKEQVKTFQGNPLQSVAKMYDEATQYQ